MKRAICYLLILLLPALSKAQGVDWGLSLLVGYPMGAWEFGTTENLGQINPGVGLGLEVDLLIPISEEWSIGSMIMINSLGLITGQSTGLGPIHVTTSSTTYTPDHSTSFFTLGPFAQYSMAKKNWKPYLRLFTGYVFSQTSLKIDYANLSDTYAPGTVGEIRFEQSGFALAPGIGVKHAVIRRGLYIDFLLQFHICFNGVNNEAYSIYFHDASERTDVEHMIIGGQHFLSLHVGMVF